MSYYDQLSKRVLESIRSGRLGQPVFVRVIAPVSPGQPNSRAVLEPWIAAVGGWIGSSLERLYVAESADRGDTTVTLQFRSGASALVST